MKLIKFAEAKKTPKRITRLTKRLENQIIKKRFVPSLASAVKRKLSIWDQEGKSTEEVMQKLDVFKARRVAKNKALASKNQAYEKSQGRGVSSPLSPTTKPSLAQALKDEGIDVAKLDRAPIRKPTEKVISPKGGGKGLLIGAGVATGAVVLGGLGYGLYRKIRSDKGKKRGSYKNFNFLGDLIRL